MEAKDITDSTDWHGTRVPRLSALDSALRCQVCKDFFTAPVNTPCGHTFCSLCIRRYFSTGKSQQCPTCRHGLPESDQCLRQNHTVQEILDGFLGCRDAVMEELKKVPAPPPPPPQAEDTRRGENGGKRRGKRQTTTVSRGNSNTDADSEYADSSSQGMLRRSTRSRRSNNGGTLQMPPAGVEIIGIDDDDDDYIEDEEDDEQDVRRRKMKKKQQKHEDLDEDYDPQERVVEEVVVEEPDDGLVGCPNCSRRMPINKVNTHLDKCLNGIIEDTAPSPAKPSFGLSSHPLQKASIPKPAFASPSKPPPPKEERLAKLNYAVMKEAGLRSKCRDRGIPSTGNKAQMEKRYTEWVNIFNANLDSINPKTKNQLLRDLDRWERQEAMGQANEVRTNPFKQEGFSGERWAEQHDDTFQNLIAQAMGNRKRRKVEEGEVSSVNGNGAERAAGGEGEGLAGREEEIDMDTLRRKSPGMGTTMTTTVVTQQTVTTTEAMQTFHTRS